MNAIIWKDETITFKNKNGKIMTKQLTRTEKMEIERKKILNKKLAIKKEAVRVVNSILKMSKILDNPLHGSGVKKAAKRIKEAKEVELRDLQWQFQRFIG